MFLNLELFPKPCNKSNYLAVGVKCRSVSWRTRLQAVKSRPLCLKGSNKLLTIIALYVDDFFVFSNDAKETGHLKIELGSKFKLKGLGKAKNCLGMRITRDKYKGIITLDQESYVNQILNKFNMLDCKPIVTPMETNVEFDPNVIDNDKVFLISK